MSFWLSPRGSRVEEEVDAIGGREGKGRRGERGSSESSQARLCPEKADVPPATQHWPCISGLEK